MSQSSSQRHSEQTFAGYLAAIAAEYEGLQLENEELRRSLATEDHLAKSRPGRTVCEMQHHMAPPPVSALARVSTAHVLRGVDESAGRDTMQAKQGKGGPHPANPKVFDIKEKLRDEFLKHEANASAGSAESRFYKKTGVFRQIAIHPMFEATTLLVIGLYALWMSIDTDHNNGTQLSDTHPIFIIADQLFCIYFVVELVIRFLAFHRKVDCLRDAWFAFDFILVVLIVSETWILIVVLQVIQSSSTSASDFTFGNSPILRIVRLLRLSRLFRMAHVVRKVPELLIMVKAMAAAGRSVSIAMILLTLLLYVFGIAFTSVLEGTSIGKESFDNVPLSMHSLLMHGAFLDDISGMMAKLLEESYIGFCMMYVVMILAAISVMNMLIGILCEVISAVSDVEHEAIHVRYVTDTLQRCLTQPGTEDGDGTLDEEAFYAMLQDPDAVKALKEIEIDVLSLVDYVSLIFGDCHDKILFSDFIQILLQLRGGNTCTVKDLVDFRKWLSLRLEHIERLTKHAVSQPAKNLNRMNAREGLSTVNVFRPTTSHEFSHVPQPIPDVVSEWDLPGHLPSQMEIGEEMIS